MSDDSWVIWSYKPGLVEIMTMAPPATTDATFRIITVGEMPPTITCLLCWRTSAHPGDVVNRYCGHCHLFHETVALGRAMVNEGGTHECHEWRTGRGRCALCGQATS